MSQPDVFSPMTPRENFEESKEDINKEDIVIR